MCPHTYITQPHETYCPPIIVLGFQPGLLVTVSRKDNVKYPYSLLRKTKPLSVSLTLLLLRLCMMPFTVYLTLPPERFGFGEIPQPAQPSPPSASLYPQELVESHTAKSRGILISPRLKFSPRFKGLMHWNISPQMPPFQCNGSCLGEEGSLTVAGKLGQETGALSQRV